MFLGAIILIGYIANIFSEKSKIPESLFMIIIGLLVGPVFGIVDPTNLKSVAGIFSVIAMIIVLIDSGLEFDISLIVKKMLHATIFTVIVNLLSTVGIGLAVHYLFGWNILHAMLLGVVSSGTTTVMVQTLLEGLKVNKDVKHLLILESIINDTTLIIISVSIISLIKQHSQTLFDSALVTAKNFVVQLAIASVFAVISFIIWLELSKRIPAHKKKEYVFVLGLLFLQYGIVEFFGGSGVISVLFFSLLLGNLHPISKFLNLKEKYYTKMHIRSLKSIKVIQLDLSFFIKTFFFIFLGIITDLKAISLKVVLITLCLITIILLTRYIAARVMTRIDKKYKKDAFIISTMMPRGFVATLLAFLPFNEGIIIPQFPEIILFSIFFTSIVSIVGVMVFNIRNAKAE
ncbi:MAG: cation:proton antiporter [Candidatus Woesearchaeota archaeon]|nr:cation:proton antiporter [Candidatus Woesearchaeota archaeon]